MKTFGELTTAEKDKAREKALSELLEGIVSGAIRFDDKLNSNTLQASIDAAGEASNRNQTPWFASSFIMEASFSDTSRPGEKCSVGEELRGMAECSAEESLYSEASENVVAGIILPAKIDFPVGTKRSNRDK